MATLTSLDIDDTGHLTLPSGTTAERPNSPQAGYIRYNTTLQVVEYYDGAGWRRADNLVSSSATGAVTTTEVIENGIPYTVYTYTGTGSLTIDSSGEIEYVVVAGGGGGGGWGGGGGGGGFIQGTSLVTAQTYTITVGGAGASLGRNPGYVYGGDGGDSSIVGTGFNITADGGGGGAPWSDNTGRTGGSGGGGSGNNTTRSSYVEGQGYAGGSGPGTTASNPYRGHGGGGGAGEPGENGPSPRQRTIGGKGGDGRCTTIKGFPMWFSGGGGAHSPGAETSEVAYGGKGGGGIGGNYYNPFNAYPGGTNTGGGGGGAYGAEPNGTTGPGGSGIVIIRHRKKTTSRLSQPLRIPQEGLMIHLDASNPDSYKYHQTPTVWRNIAGFTGNATVYGRPTFEQTTAGGLVFDGGAVYAEIPFSTEGMDFSAAQTICMWLRPTEDDGNRRNPYNQAYGGSGTITHEPAGNFNYYYGTNGANASPYVGKGSGFTVGEGPNNELAMITVVRDQDANITRWYKNGVWDGNTSDAGSYKRTANGSSNILIGLGYTNYYVGSIYEVMVYNQGLSDVAVKQIYEATRSKYGV
jgi:hypothetical protein